MSEVDEPLPLVNVVKKKWVDFDKTAAAVEEMVDGVNEINQNYRASLEDGGMRSSNKEETGRESNREANREMNRETNREMNRETNKESSRESTGIHLPPPPKPERTRKTSNKSNQNEIHQPDRHHSSRSSTPHLSSSPTPPSSSSKITNHQSNHNLDGNPAGRSTDRHQRADRLAERSAGRPSSRQSDSDKANRDEYALNIPESFIRTNSANLQNVPLRDLPSNNAPQSTGSLPNSSNDAQGSSRFKNGDVLVTLLPLNTQCAWITPAIFRPELVPEELMSSEFRLTVEDYVSAMQMLVNDYRFNAYIVFYKKVTLIWLTLGFFILFSLLFSNAEGVVLFFGMLIWILINAFGFLLTWWLKIKMLRNLERCLARVNEQFYKYNILLGVDDRGKISCHKINLIFLYFDGTECIKYLNNLLNRDAEVDSINNTIRNLNQLNNNSIDLNQLNKYGTGPAAQTIDMRQQDVDISDIIITGSQPTRLTQRDKYGEKLFLRYSQRWAKDFTRQRIGFSTPLHYDPSTVPPANLQPRHCEKARCVCQYIEEHMAFKPFHKCGFRDIFG